MRAKLTRLPLALALLCVGAVAFAHSPLGRSIRAFRLDRVLQPGYDAFGRNLAALTASAGGTSIGIALLLAAVAIAVAFSLCSLIEFSSRPAIGRLLDPILLGASAFPSVLFALGWAAYRGPGWGTLSAALLFSVVPDLTRLLILRTREIKREPFLEAAIALGATPLWVSFKHVSPHLIPLVRAKLPGLLSRLILGEATLSFLGVGAPIGQDTWGMLLLQSRDYLIEAPMIAIMSGVPLALLVLTLQRVTRDRIFP